VWDGSTIRVLAFSSSSTAFRIRSLAALVGGHQCLQFVAKVKGSVTEKPHLVRESFDGRAADLLRDLDGHLGRVPDDAAARLRPAPGRASPLLPTTPTI
jgi:hypothetical protein